MKLTSLLLSTALLAASPAAQTSTLAEAHARLEALERRLGSLEHATWSAGPVVLCLDVAADFSPIHPTRALPGGVRELSLTIESGAAARFRELMAVFVAIDVGDAAPPETEMARAVQPAAKDRRARFRYHQDAPLPAGRCRVELLGDGVPWCTLRYSVLDLAESAPPSFPLTPGRTWHYDFEQHAVDGARLSDGESSVQHLTGAVEIRVAELAGGSARVEFRRDGELVSQEEWRVDERGLVATRRGFAEDEFVLDPPQPLLSASSGVSAWEWTTPGLPGVQHCRQWGPLELAGPWGRAQGYVVRSEQVDGALLHTAEREFVPTLGLVRERIVTALGGLLLSEQELVLRP